MACFLCVYGFAEAQSNFRINNDKGIFTMPFELVNNLVIIPLEINGLELSFLLDTGVDATILFSLGTREDLELKNTEEILLRGWGDGEPIRALKSSGNEVKMGDIFNPDLNVYLVFDNPLGLSNRMGVPVNGIIGYDLFKDFIIEFNYVSKRILIYNPQNYNARRCKKCDELDIILYRNKPYVNITGEINKKSIPLNMLVDSGSGDALWLFENDSDIKLPADQFKDFLGFGIGGSIYGSRSRIDGINFGKYTFPSITASFPDSAYYKGINTYESRNGSIGAQVLKRLHLTIDYPAKKLRFRPNKDFNKPFEYDMSGVIVAHDGFTVIEDILRNPIAFREEDRNNTGVGSLVYSNTYDVKFSLEPQYKIVEIRPNSPAAQAGLLEEDILLKINGRPAYKFSLSQITRLLSSTDGKKMKLVVERKGIEKTVVFFLKRSI